METNWTAWARGLRFFRLCHSRGGLADDNGDSVIAAFAITSEQDMVQTLARLDITAQRIGPDEAVPQVGVSYTGEEYAKLAQPITAYPAYKQPGHVLLAGRRAHVWVYADKIEITVLDKEHPYDVTAKAVQDAQTIEPLLTPLASKLVNQPRDPELCA